ncbi:hypothetical protein AB0F96_35355 [Streptomyces sp. NPDC023998]|uniref:hypothetical protein n=1 Tax=Streptomyces sp. NPDC023998 TaxID=3154597 RepID=UPI0033DC1947
MAICGGRASAFPVVGSSPAPSPATSPPPSDTLTPARRPTAPARPTSDVRTHPAAPAPRCPEPRRKTSPLHVPQPAFPAPALLQSATELLAGLHHQDPRLLLSARDADRLAPGVAAWLERDVSPAAVRHALTADLPPDGVRRPVGLLAHRLTVRLPSPPPFRARAQQHPLQTCDSCDRAFRSPEPGDCRACLAAAHRKPD